MVGCSGGTGTDRERKGRKKKILEEIYIYRVESNGATLSTVDRVVETVWVKRWKDFRNDRSPRLASPRLVEMCKKWFLSARRRDFFRSKKFCVTVATTVPGLNGKRYFFAREYFSRYFSPLPSPLFCPTCYLAAHTSNTLRLLFDALSARVYRENAPFFIPLPSLSS